MRKLLLVVAVLAIVGLGVAAYLVLTADETGGSTASGGATKVITDQKAIAAQVVGFIRNPYKDDYDLTRVTGYLDNKGKTAVKSADVEIQLLDKEGNKKELVKYQVVDIPPNQRKTFDANAGTISDSREAKMRVTKLVVVSE